MLVEEFVSWRLDLLQGPEVLCFCELCGQFHHELLCGCVVSLCFEVAFARVVDSNHALELLWEEV